jgi:hypothetical protein
LVPVNAEQPAAASAAVSTAAPDSSVRGRNLPEMNPTALPGVLIAIFIAEVLSVGWFGKQKGPAQRSRS